jgi:hypothetical protein
MTVKKLAIKPGVNRENTRYSNEGGWYECDKVRFRQGTPEKIGGWQRFSTETFLGVCRSLWNWLTLGGQNLIGVGTNLKFYIERGGDYFNITPFRRSVTLTDPFDTVDTLTLVTVTDTAHGCITGDTVVFSGASLVGGLDLNGEYVVTVLGANSYTITASSPATSTVTGGGGTVDADYEINIGSEISVPFTGYGAGPYGLGPYGLGGATVTPLRLWNQSNFGEDLVFSYRGGPLLYWDATLGTLTRGVYVSSLPGASDVPLVVNVSLVSDINRFVFAFGCDDYGSSDLDPLLVRWSDQEDITMWTPSATNQAGSLRFSRGTAVIAAIQARQEVLVWTDTALYSLQYLGAPEVWGAQILGDNISIASPNAAVYANNIAYWMGRDKFYRYDGTVIPLPCDVRRYVFNDFNFDQYAQVFAGTNQAFNEVWWFYCSASSTQLNRYVVYNYVDNLWYYGTLRRTAWIDAKLRDYPIAATYTQNLVFQEFGADCNETGTTFPINAYVVSSEFDLEDGDKFVLVNSVFPDVTFDGSTADTPALTMTLLPLDNSGAGYSNPLSQGGNSSNSVVRAAVLPIEAFTGQVFTRIRGRQLALRVESTGLGVKWQLGTTRLDMRPDGKRGRA